MTLRGLLDDSQPDRLLVIFPGPAGWTQVFWRFQQPDEIKMHIRFAPRDDTFDAVELRLREPWLDRLRELPIRRIESALRASVPLREMLRIRYEEAEPDLSDPTAFCIGSPPERFRLSRPTTRRLPDDFYADVSIAYMAAVEAGLNPRKTLAADSGTPADTVARWIGQARKRSHLPPGEQGKVTT